MKVIFLILISIFLIQPKGVLKNKVSENQNTTKDTIIFIPSFNFIGRCEGLCNVYVGGKNTVKEINGKLLEKNANVDIFVKCPTKIRLRKGVSYKFIAENFVLNSCSTIIDTIKNTKRYSLLEQIK